eukprot:scaffold87560_cov69-Attheya_sp.AAC.2
MKCFPKGNKNARSLSSLKFVHDSADDDLPGPPTKKEGDWQKNNKQGGKKNKKGNCNFPPEKKKQFFNIIREP